MAVFETLPEKEGGGRRSYSRPAKHTTTTSTLSRRLHSGQHDQHDARPASTAAWWCRGVRSCQTQLITSAMSACCAAASWSACCQFGFVFFSMKVFVLFSFLSACTFLCNFILTVLYFRQVVFSTSVHYYYYFAFDESEGRGASFFFFF